MRLPNTFIDDSEIASTFINFGHLLTVIGQSNCLGHPNK